MNIIYFSVITICQILSFHSKKNKCTLKSYHASHPVFDPHDVFTMLRNNYIISYFLSKLF